MHIYAGAQRTVGPHGCFRLESNHPQIGQRPAASVPLRRAWFLSTDTNFFCSFDEEGWFVISFKLFSSVAGNIALKH